MKKTVKVIPHSKTEAIIEADNELIVRLKKPAEKGKANKALVKLLSKHFNARVKIVSGLRSRKKIIEIEN